MMEWELSVSVVNGAKEACSRQPECQDVLHYSPHPKKTYKKVTLHMNNSAPLL